MKTVNKLFVAVSLTIMVGSLATGQSTGQTSPSGQSGKAKLDQEHLQGEWRIISRQVDGKKIPHTISIHFLGNKLFSYAPEAIPGFPERFGHATFELDTTKSPKEINFTNPKSPKSQRAIYLLENDSLTVCRNLKQPAKLPAAFTADKGDRQEFIVYQRMPSGPKTPEALAQQKLRRVGLAMHIHHDAEKHLPLHAIYSKDGKTPLLSWRVAILQHLDEPIYAQFKLDEPWDSEHNKKLISKMPDIFAAWGDGKENQGLTYFQVFSGPNTVFDGPKKMSFREINDGTSNTIMVIEAKEPVIWTKPDDLTLPKDKDKLPFLGGVFKDRMHVLLVDGSVQSLHNVQDPAVFRPFVTPNAGDDADRDKLKLPPKSIFEDG